MNTTTLLGGFVAGSFHLMRRFRRYRNGRRVELPPLYLSAWPRPRDWRDHAAAECRRHGYAACVAAAGGEVVEAYERKDAVAA